MYNKNGSSPDKILYYTKQVFSKRGNHFILLSRTYAWDSSSGARVCEYFVGDHFCLWWWN